MSERATALHASTWQGVLYVTGGGSGLLDHYPSDVCEQAMAIVQDAQRELEAPLADELINARFRWISAATERAVRRDRRPHRSLTDRLDAVLLNRVAAMPISSASTRGSSQPRSAVLVRPVACRIVRPMTSWSKQ